MKPVFSPRFVRPDDFPVSRLAVNDLHGSLLVNTEKTSKKTSFLPGSLLARYIFRRLPINLPKSAPDLENMHIKKCSSGLKTETVSVRLYRSTFIEPTKYISKWKIRTIWLKTCNKNID
ncbi:hypothetical protein IGI04_002461 [Brassica rapa subsp. trilocularis]|uniref:Uncharacterized protein n=1 Tax=Brassica rapa subsp. trilocularis TaxID=1813537 RepID=A0ABQ7NVN2_BRACM|nr:hypothetical protein IGI04_002461 [Brassica rapa subsp. trilocularis]